MALMEKQRRTHNPMSACGSLRWTQKLTHQQRLTFIRFVRTQGAVYRTCFWTIDDMDRWKQIDRQRRDSVPLTQLDDDVENVYKINTFVLLNLRISVLAHAYACLRTFRSILYMYLSLPSTRQDLTQGQKPEIRLKWG